MLSSHCVATCREDDAASIEEVPFGANLASSPMLET
jgi:hypothetical protein